MTMTTIPKRKKKPAPFKFKPFSKKQLKVLTWWKPNSPVKDYDGIICDGSIRAGKTVSMALSYVMWAMESFEGENFGMCGKTIGSHRRNVITPLKKMLKSRGYKVKDHRSENMLTITKDGVTNFFYIFGGKDEASQDLIQGITLAGCFFDEVVLMVRSFVNQATGRCSVEGSKVWFNCNPGGPYHWFKTEWLDKAREKNLLHIRFTMDDNLSLSEKVKQRYYKMYSGVFFKRYILGLWAAASGLIFDMFDEDKHKVPTIQREYIEYFVSCDYGTQNAMVYGLWGKCIEKDKEVWYKVKEYRYSGRETEKQKTDQEYYEDFEKFVGDLPIRGTVVDPSAASFIALLVRNKRKVYKARNNVKEGIGNVGVALNTGIIYFNDCCNETFKEFASYIWDEKSVERGEDKPLKENDHHMDETRYFINTIIFGLRKKKKRKRGEAA
ncbi:phage terminase, large subunit, PBSX family (plasmid) [Bacillus thuringiensis]|uniref:PBSX family phage terminase large subunit n=1 Tax=Bacillus thuringiensis TaxID=1428 RepID=UPI0005A348B8|nr:PBSX family phage terminase large subunit [Bacillus thuringiensis]HDR4520532.1 PBSX family phage terminase large subunit [Bacillus cereus]AJH66311.1 phage terminase, large subunit, PBSX family [Bacillus thuringiensis]QKH33354.1 PBSX family phage terminase large subunit [Bacillus thuringiensis]QKQ37849.1 PBSX family phage terminase large subunit [Bacillus thuringiensis]HDR8034922.1 PBSX family phage terminase large subunit [Bacillus cereus]